MNGEKIWESLQQIDPEWIEDAAKYPRRKPVRMTMRRVISLAACFAVMFTSGGFLLFADFSGGQAGSTDAATGSFVSSSYSVLQIVLIAVCIASMIGILMILMAFARGGQEDAYVKK